MLITTLVVSFCKDGGGSVSVKLWYLVMCVRCEVVCLYSSLTAPNLQHTANQGTYKLFHNTYEH